MYLSPAPSAIFTFPTINLYRNKESFETIALTMLRNELLFPWKCFNFSFFSEENKQENFERNNHSLICRSITIPNFLCYVPEFKYILLVFLKLLKIIIMGDRFSAWMHR